MSEAGRQDGRPFVMDKNQVQYCINFNIAL